MNAILLDFSRRPELERLGLVVADVQKISEPLGIQLLIVGASARDLHLLHGHGIEPHRHTEDIDLAIAIPDWAAYEVLYERLVTTGAFRASSAATHRLHHQTGLPIAFVPFDGVETRERTIEWPPRGDIVMNVFGFKEARSKACEVLLPGPTRTQLVSLPALALLKLVCWKDRHYASPRKDAHDLLLIVRSYLGAGNESRLWDEFLHWTTESGQFDFELAGARMLGHDMSVLLSREGRDQVCGLLTEQADPMVPARLPAEMIRSDPDRARALLEVMLDGVMNR